MFRAFLKPLAPRESWHTDIRLKNIRDFATGAHRQVDDRPYGGGPGMLLCLAQLLTR